MGTTAANVTAVEQVSHDEQVALLTKWLEDMGGTNIQLQRQRRWRPVWHVTMTRNGVPTKMMMKGERTWLTHPYPLTYEMQMQRTLHENGIPIPAIIGMCDNPSTMAMEWVEGGRDAGLIQEAIERGSTISPDRWQASLRYMEILADMHRVPPEKFVAAGATMPTNAEELALGNFERFHAMTKQAGITDPFIEFGSRWLRRNYPKNRNRVAFITGDCGQFMSDGPNVSCVMDVEIGHLGDPMRDLACFRGRHPIENMGDLPALWKKYEEAIGEPNDYDALAFYTVSFLLEAYYGPLFGMYDMARGGDWVEAAGQLAIIGRRCMEALAEIIGIELEFFDLPEPEPTPYEDLALGKLMAEIGRIPESDAFQDWQRNVLASVPAYLRTRGHYRAWCDREDLADVAAVTGTSPSNVVEADADLIRFIEQAGPEHDAALTRLFHRRLQRHCLIIAGPNAAPDHIAFAKTDPVLHLKA